MSTETPRADDPVERDLWPCWHHEGWECAGELSMQEAKDLSYSRAKHAYLGTVPGDGWNDVGVWKRYVQPLTRQQAWEKWGREREVHLAFEPGGMFAPDEIREALPETVPDEWDPGYMEGYATWQFVPKGAPRAVAYWVCGEAGHPPPRPTWGRNGERYTEFEEATDAH